MRHIARTAGRTKLFVSCLKEKEEGSEKGGGMDEVRKEHHIWPNILTQSFIPSLSL